MYPYQQSVTASFLCVFIVCLQSNVVTSQLECVDYDSLQMSAYSNLYTHLPSVSGNGTNNVTSLNATHVHDVIEHLEEAVGCQEASCQVRTVRVTCNQIVLLLNDVNFFVVLACKRLSGKQ